MTTQVQSNNSYISTHETTGKDQLLRNALRGNGMFSTVSGIAFIVGSSQIADFLGIADADILGLMKGSTFLLITGVSLLLFAGGLFFNSSRSTIIKGLAWEAVALDVIWVLGSAIVLLTDALPFTTAGSWAVLIVADIVATFALFQYLGIRRMNK